MPILLKNNIATADRMMTTAGSLALAGVTPPKDAFIVERLRAAGAVILGKTNVSEWANFRSTHSTSGLERTRRADKESVSLSAAAIGTETDGSIVSPSSNNGLVGIKPTLGLLSRTGIVPIAHSQDTAGPMTRRWPTRGPARRDGWRGSRSASAHLRADGEPATTLKAGAHDRTRAAERRRTLGRAVACNENILKPMRHGALPLRR